MITPHQQTQAGMIGGGSAGAANIWLTWIAAYGTTVSLILGTISVAVVVLSFVLDLRRKDRQEARDAEMHAIQKAALLKTEGEDDVGIP